MGYGLLGGRHVPSRAHVILVDRRSPRKFLAPSEQVNMSSQCWPTVAARGQSCEKACTVRGMECDRSQFHFLNDCRVLEKHFWCKLCAHQVGEELPVYVPDRTQPTYGQCLVTF